MIGRLTLWITLVVPLGVLGIVLSQMRLLDPVQNGVGSFVVPIEAAIYSLARQISSIGDSSSTAQLEQLRIDNQRLQAEIASLREMEHRYEELSRLLRVTEARPQDRFLVANVITYDPSGFRYRIAIDKGSDDGITEGMTVLSEGNALVGTVSRVNSSYAWVTLVTDPQSSVNALIQPSRAQGVVSGGVGQELRMELVPQQADIKPGDMVVTSGVGGTYPVGLLIGQVASVKGSPQEVFQEIRLKPAASLVRLEMVLVLTSFHPIELEMP